jgi:hypothetical protein
VSGHLVGLLYIARSAELLFAGLANLLDFTWASKAVPRPYNRITIQPDCHWSERHWEVARKMIHKLITALCLGVLLIVSSACLSGGAKQTTESKANLRQPETEPVATTVTLPSQTSQGGQKSLDQEKSKEAPVAAPGADEINEVVLRVYEKVAVPDVSLEPGYVLGDFNGDGSQDLAVVVKIGNDMLTQINNELANWTLEDPMEVREPNAAAVARTAPAKRARAEKGDSFLAIIHGVGQKGWRNPEARQSFLLKNAAGTSMTVRPVSSKENGNEKEKLPPLRGDAIRMILGGRPGMLLWTGAKYAWHSIDDKEL